MLYYLFLVTIIYMERSAGAIVFYDNQGIREYLLLYSSGGRGLGYWGFPKGHVEKNETDEEAALRETFEEKCLTFPNTKNMLSDADEFLKTIVKH